ncbi:MAG: hypothetical protein RIS63_1489, partial [Bacteroidota bacterium]
FDYVQYKPFDLSPYDLSVQIMLPNASSGIGTSVKPQVDFEPGGYKWKLQVGRNFSLFIEDYGDYAFRFAEFKRKLLKPNPFFEIEVVRQSDDILIYRRKVKGEFVAQKNARFYIYSVKRLHNNYYEIMNREQGDTKRVIDFMYHTIQSIKAQK